MNVHPRSISSALAIVMLEGLWWQAAGAAASVQHISSYSLNYCVDQMPGNKVERTRVSGKELEGRKEGLPGIPDEFELLT